MRVELKQIICSTDFSDFSNCAIPYATALAREFKSKLYFCHVIDLSSAAVYGEAVLALEEQQKRMIAYAREELSALMADQEIDWEQQKGLQQVQPQVTPGGYRFFHAPAAGVPIRYFSEQSCELCQEFG